MKRCVVFVIIVMSFAGITFSQPAIAQAERFLTATEAKGQPDQDARTSSAKAEALSDFLSNRGTLLRHFITKHGELKTVDEHGNFGKDTHVMLNGVFILKAQKTNDGLQQELFVDPYELPLQESTDRGHSKRPVKIDRILLSEGCGLNYVTQFILLDFTCDKPFVSERFGFNPDLEGYVYLEKVKWGKEKSYIYMHVNQRAVYYTCDRVEMDWDYYMRKEEEDKKNKKNKKNSRQIKPDKSPFRQP